MRFLIGLKMNFFGYLQAIVFFGLCFCSVTGARANLNINTPPGLSLGNQQ